MFPVAEIDDVTAAFPADVGSLMPPYADIPREFKHGRTKWNRLFSDMFYFGLSSLQLAPRDGIDKQKAWRHIRTISQSFQPAHEHKEAAVAYLLDQWFEDATWTRAERPAMNGDLIVRRDETEAPKG
jgi:hypothetical protein